MEQYKLSKEESEFITKSESNFKKVLLDVFENDQIAKQEKIIICAFMGQEIFQILKSIGLGEWFVRNFIDKGENQDGSTIPNKLKH